MNKNEAQELIEKYKNGTCTPEEKIRLEQWYNSLPTKNKYPDLPQVQDSMQKVWDNLNSTLNIVSKKEIMPLI